MSESRSRRAWKSARRIFRWFRIAALLVVLAVAGFLFYWSQAGLPDFIKKAVLVELRNHGLELSFQKIRFRWDRGIVAEQVDFGRAQLVSGPQLTLDELQIGISPGHLLKGRVAVDRLELRGGRLVWHFAGTNQPAMPLVMENISSHLVVREGEWELQSFQGRFHGADFRLSGVLSNTVFLPELWRAWESNSPARAVSNRWAAETTDAVLRRFAEALKAWQFSGDPTVALKFRADATNLTAAALALEVRATDAATPYGRFHDAFLRAEKLPGGEAGAPARVAVMLRLGEARTPWGDGHDLVLNTQLAANADSFWETNLTFRLNGRQIATRWGRGGNVALDLAITPAQTNLIFAGDSLETEWAKARRGKGTLRRYATAEGGAGRWDVEVEAEGVEIRSVGVAQQTRLKADCELRADRAELRALKADITLAKAETQWGKADEAIASLEARATRTNGWALLQATNALFWERVAGLDFRWDARLTGAQAQSLDFSRVETAGAWRAPRLSLEKFNAQLYGGELALAGSLDSETREVALTTDARFDYRKIGHLLPESARNELAKITWETPPATHAHLGLVLPSWTNRAPDWVREVLPSLALEAAVQAGECAYDGVAASELQTSVIFSNRLFCLPDVHWRAGESQLWLALTNRPDGTFALAARGQADWERFRPLLGTSVQRGLALAKFTAPPWVETSVRGKWGEPNTIQFEARVRATNFTFREVQIDRLETEARFAEKVLSFSHPVVERAEGRGEADAVVADFDRQVVLLTNAQGCLEPMAVARAIGPHLVRTIKPYQFAQPPRAKVGGLIPMHGEKGAEVRFDVAGGPFQWWRFKVTNVAATILWRGETVTITNLASDFYQGRLVGDLVVDFTPTNHTDLYLKANVSDAQFNDLMRDISERTNKVEGLLSGHLSAQAVVEDWKSWQGYGNVELRDGLIWDIPVFGLFSPVLNKVSPGLGNSRAHRGAATFTITNSVIASEDLEIKSRAFNLKYAGTVDFDYRLNARVEAEILRQTWLIGPTLSFVLKPFTKLFEYKVTGTLADPKSRPVYLPKFLVSPIKSLKDWFGKEEKETPAPPEIPEKPEPGKPSP